MFTGLVQAKTRITRITPEGSGCRIVLQRPVDTPECSFRDRVSLGASIAINGCCLTVVHYDERQWEFEAGSETLARTNLGQLHTGDEVNIETSLRLGDPLGGHWVTGHIDGLGTLVDRSNDGKWSTYRFEVPPALARQMASKGSVAVDGVSLTLVEVTSDQFTVALIPHTLEVTTLGSRNPGDSVNLETDVLAKYVERQLGLRTAIPAN
ncbi:MAG: riboflavin synthase [Planctomycetaceae bacterium]|nr:riboflavin synthase [Planctomycetaceae bacterium]